MSTTTSSTANDLLLDRAPAFNATMPLPPPTVVHEPDDSDSSEEDDSPVRGFNAWQAPRPARDFWPNGKRSLAGISIRAFLLGLTLGLCIALTVLALYLQYPIWRVPFFFVALSVFHFLEFYITAAYNPPVASIASFLFSNGSQYTMAHTAAAIEAFVMSCFFPGWQARLASPTVIAIGLGLVVIGQTARSVAMVQAGTNFNHHVQTRRNSGHELVETGIYGVLRHPSYFGFFWWGLGTQLVLGNAICFCMYSWALWIFFSRRIRTEEKYLIHFFGTRYETYRKKTTVGIPFIS